MWLYFIMGVEFAIIVYAINMIKETKQNYKSTQRLVKPNGVYCVKPFMSNYEYNFYLILKNIEDVYSIVPQLNLASVIKKNNSNNKYHNELFRNIDFAIFTKDYKKLLLLIEINDASHNLDHRKERDFKVKNICDDANIKLMTFYTNKPNEPNYVIKRILDEIEIINN